MGLKSLSSTVAALFFAATGPAFEPVATFQASKILPAEIVKGPHHTVSEEVKAEGFYQQFHVVSDFGDIDVEGRTMLRTRVSEIDAIARLSEVSRGEVFAKAAGGAVLHVGKGVVSVITEPVATAKGIGGGLKRFGVNLGRKAKRAANSATKDDKKPEGPERTKKAKALDAAGGAANSVLGVNGAARRWAEKLRVDPYTTNPLCTRRSSMWARSTPPGRSSPGSPSPFRRWCRPPPPWAVSSGAPIPRSCARRTRRGSPSWGPPRKWPHGT